MKEIMYYFGYAKIKEDPDNYTGFHEYAESDPALLKSYYGYKELNKHSLQWNECMTDEQREEI